ncbi:MAG: glycosyltransferase family 39 protein [Planctomycetaceae bacterium]|nr:glycosyltransferase family 39 protein [Planctomycetaceae bacterium]
MKTEENNRFDGTKTFLKTETVFFWSIVCSFALVWAVLPTLFHTGYRNDVIEILFIGKEWVPADAKHPALPSWLTEIVGLLTNRTFITPFLAGQFCTIVTVWSIWRLARFVLAEKHAMIAAFAILPFRLLTNESVLFNHNLVLLATCALSVFLVFQAFQTNRLPDWIAAGAAIGLALHSKYPSALLVVAILLYMILRPAGRRHWFHAGPYVTTVVAFSIFLPHLIWLFNNDFPTLTYISNTASSRLQGNLWSHLVFPLRFAASQPLYWMPALVVLLPALGWPWTWKSGAILHENTRAKECERFLFYCSVIPFAVFLAVSAFGIHLRMVYGAPFWCFLSIWLMLRFQIRDHPRLLMKTVLCLVGVEAVIITGFIGEQFLGKPLAPAYLPMAVLSQECDRVWQEQHFNVPCPYVTGDMILAGHAAYRMSNRPTVHKNGSTWSSDEDVNRYGGLVVWPMEGNSGRENAPSWVRERFPGAKVLPPDTLVLSYPPLVQRRLPPLKVGIAVIPPP